MVDRQRIGRRSVTITPLGLYIDNGVPITTHSMLKTYLRCPKQAQYKYAERLKPKRISARQMPLRRGTWFHRLLELYYRGEDWRAEHIVLTEKYAGLFDEEKEALGDLPTECMRLMRSYLWHYGADKSDPYHGWKVIDTELTLECPWPDGEGVYRCRLDVLAEDQYGLFIGDHKTNKRLPGHTTRVLDAASALYLWCARENGLDVYGFLWNYIRTKAPTVPKLVYQGTARERLSTAAIDTDYPTMVRAIKSYGIEKTDKWDRGQVAALKAQRWHDGMVQTSPFFRRTMLEKDDDMIAGVVATAMRTRDRMRADGWDAPETIERVADTSCDWMCDYTSLCETELFGGDGKRLRRQDFRVGDPLDYYQDQRDTTTE